MKAETFLMDEQGKFYQVIKEAKHTIIICEVRYCGGIPMKNNFIGEKFCRKIYNSDGAHIKIDKYNMAYIYSKLKIIKKAA